MTVVSLLTSTLLYGATPYMVTSTQGGPVKDELGGILSFAESSLNETLTYEATIIDVSDRYQNSLWYVTPSVTDLKEGTVVKKTDAFPIGSKTCTVKFTVTNNAMTDMNIYRLFVKGWFEGSKWLASPVVPASTSKHVELGYKEYLVDHFGSDANEWIIPAGQSVTFAETFHIDDEDAPLNIQIIIPKEGEEKDFAVLDAFQLHC